ncbi:ectonucleoside triphosphate diphosphohydrolase 3 isoform X2 [Girardinichthys multiradiatus]|nr:ectonucleoside triphosphate diphosphohydrolase 3 isoform X2 [Girardinichthys multiradiatus]
MASKKKMGYKCRIAGVMLLLIGSIAALVVVSVIQDKLKVKEYGLEYGIVIDSGSSRSNVYLYEWPGEKENETGVVTEKMNCKVKGVPISELKVSSKEYKTTLNGFQDCMDEIRKHIPEEKQKTTPLFLGATAGMRLLDVEDKKRSNEVMTSLRDYLSGQNFHFHNASIITGQEEGLYGWITVNYLMGNFLERNMWNTYVRPNGAETVGSMDLGGASTQIAFQVQEQGQGPDYMLVKLYGYPYTVYTHSFLCYGKNEADKRVLDKLIKGSSGYIVNPCYPKGFNTTIKASAIYDTECTIKPKNYNPDQEFYMFGSSDSKKCGELVKSIFDFDNCSSKQCSFNGVEQPPVTGEFMAYAGFYFIAQALEQSGVSNLEQFNISVGNFCRTHWTELKAQKHRILDKYLKTYCFASHYVLTLLADGYKFDDETWENIHFEKEIKETNIGWSLGYMLRMSNMIPSEVKEILPMTNPVFAGLIFLFSALIIVTVILGFIILLRTCY